MYERQELVELGERLAEEGVHRHERALQELALAVETRSPGVAEVLRDRSAPSVMRERAFAVAADALLRTSPWLEERSDSDPIGHELQRVLLDWQGQLVAWGA